jgi:phage/plasmid-associated DNA primase
MSSAEELSQKFDAKHEHREACGTLPMFSDDALALRFSDRHGATLRYVASWNKWFRWNGVFWEQDTTLLAFDLARDLCREVARMANAGGKGLASHMWQLLLAWPKRPAPCCDS